MNFHHYALSVKANPDSIQVLLIRLEHFLPYRALTTLHYAFDLLIPGLFHLYYSHYHAAQDSCCHAYLHKEV